MSIRIVYSPRRRGVALKVSREGIVEVLAPAGFPEEEVIRLLRMNSSVVERLKKRAMTMQKKLPELSQQSSMLYLGKSYPLFTSMRLVQFDGERFMVPPGSDEERIGNLEQIYRKLAEKYIIPRAGELAEFFGIAIGTVKINKAVTRWGSCSARGDLNFSWHLIRCPDELIDSVICHELAHRFVMDHSAAFYRHLSKMDPLYAEHRTALRRFIRSNPWFR